MLHTIDLANETLAGIQEALNECGCDIRILSMRLDV